MAPSQTLYSPSQAAHLIGCSPQSIRRYCSQFGEHLSPTASPAPGEHRQLTPQDVYLLGQINEWTDAGLSYEQCHEQLATLQVPQVISVEDEEPPSTQTLIQLTETLSGVQQALTRLADSADRADALEAAQRELEKQVRELREENVDLRLRIGSPLLWMLVGAIVFGVLAAGIAVSLIALSGWAG